MSLVQARLRAFGVLGMNRRNGVYTSRWNRALDYPSVDDKLEHQAAAARRGHRHRAGAGGRAHALEVRGMLRELDAYSSFVIEARARRDGATASWSCATRKGDRFQRTGGQWLDRRRSRTTRASIISGAYALGGQPDVAFAEERLEVHPSFAAIAAEGVPDVRVVVYRGVPVMSMTRLPTRARAAREPAPGRASAPASSSTRAVHPLRSLRQPRRSTRTLTRSRRCSAASIPEFERVLEIAVRASDQTGSSATWAPTWWSTPSTARSCSS